MLNIEDMFKRQNILIGNDAFERLKKANVLIVGLGGVGSYVVEAICRSGVLNIGLVDGDRVDISNINRQLCATTKTLGRFKADVLKERILDINPYANVRAYNLFYKENTMQSINLREYNYVVDAVDDINAKLLLAIEATKHKVDIISSMGAGNRTNPTAFEVVDIFKTSNCPLAKIMRKKLKENGVSKLNVVWSRELPKKLNAKTIGSISFVPPVAGFIMASKILKDIANLP